MVQPKAGYFQKVFKKAFNKVYSLSTYLFMIDVFTKFGDLVTNFRQKKKEKKMIKLKQKIH